MTSLSHPRRVAALALVASLSACAESPEPRPDAAPLDGGADAPAPPPDMPPPDAPPPDAPNPDASPTDSPSDPTQDGTCPYPVGYPTPGCGAAARPNCQAPVLDACAALFFYCGCDGKTTVTGGCGFSFKPYLYEGPCQVADAGVDGGADHQCRMELAMFTCGATPEPASEPAWCCPARFDGTVAGAPACSARLGAPEVQTAGSCGGRRILNRAWSPLSIACAYDATTGELVGARKVAELSLFCSRSKEAVAGEAPLPPACDVDGLPALRSCP